MIYGSVCSGIEAATVAWRPLGWRAAWHAEIDKFASAVLAHRFPEIQNLGDFTTIDPAAGSIDLLVGGTPCQSFSLAGHRLGLDDPRGNLTLEFLRLAARARPRWLVWENVPGVLSIDSGRTFGTVLGTLAGLGYGLAYRVLDAQFFGVPQRRRRVFLVGCLGGWQAAAAVLFERESLRRDLAPRRKKEEIVTAITANSLGTCGSDRHATERRRCEAQGRRKAAGASNSIRIGVGSVIALGKAPCPARRHDLQSGIITPCPTLEKNERNRLTRRRRISSNSPNISFPSSLLRRGLPASSTGRWALGVPLLISFC